MTSSGGPAGRARTVWFGGDYNPEQWPEQVWAEDVALMRSAGVTLVTVGVFAWARLEPRPGEYDLDWLERVIGLLHGAGIAVDLATATASPPPWVARLDPASLPMLADRARLWPGSRQAFCPSSVTYRERSLELVARIAERFGRHPAVVLWHVGNESGNHLGECFCDRSAQRLRDWLVCRHGDLDGLNAAWGTSFWSQRYSDRAEVLPPRFTPTFPNPGQRLDWRRFCSDELLDQYLAEREVLRRHSDRPVTTNFVGFRPTVDYWSWAHAGGDLDGEPAVTRHGGVFYASAPRPPAAARALVARAAGQAGVGPVLPGAPPGLEAVRRGGTLFLLNHSDDPLEVRVGRRPVRVGARDAAMLPADGDD